MIKREGYKYVILEPAKTWIAEDKCAGCGKPKSEWKRSTRWKCCSKACTDKYVRECTYYGWTELRRAAIQRDGKCVKCGQIYTTQKELMESGLTEYYCKYEIVLSKSNPKRIEMYDDTEWDVTLLDMSKYVVDHIKPIAMSGNEWDIENLQTLCKECNKIKTKKDMGDIAKLRLKEKLWYAGQKFLGGNDGN
jgi:hypothetical protein